MAKSFDQLVAEAAQAETSKDAAYRAFSAAEQAFDEARKAYLEADAALHEFVSEAVFDARSQVSA